MNYQPIYEATAFAHGFAPIQPTTIPAPCYRCMDVDLAATGPIDGLCYACRGEVAANRDDPRDELVRHLHTGHGITHGQYRPDVRFGAL